MHAKRAHMHVKDPEVLVRIWQIMETLNEITHHPQKISESAREWRTALYKSKP